MNTIYRHKQQAAFDGFIPRPELAVALLHNAKTGLTVLSAPGGYGKSWLAHQIAASMPGAAARVWTVQSTDTPTQVLKTFCARFGQQAPLKSLDPGSIADAAIAAMSCDEARTKPLIVDIDGAPPSKPVQTLIARILLEHLSHGSALVACRNPWILPIDRLATRAPLKVLKAADLALSAAELASAADVSDDAARNWLRITEGWPALCADPERWRPLSAAEDADDSLIDRVVNGYSEYMEHVLLGCMTPRDIRLMMQVSVFDTIEPGMLEALDIGGNAWSRLSGLVEAGLPVSVSRTDWDKVTLHPVFRRFLERRLAAYAASHHQTLHRRAAEYFIAVGQCGDALRHAARTGDSAFEAHVTERCGGWRICWREGVRILEPGRAHAPQLQSQLFEHSPKAALARIYWQVQTGRIDDASTALEHLHEHPASAALRSDIQVIESVLATYRDTPFDEDRFQCLATVRPVPDEDEPFLVLGGATVQAAILSNAGLYDRATSVARLALAEIETLGGNRYLEFYGHLHYAASLHGLGRVEDAIPEYLHARALAEEVFGADSSEHRMSGLLAAHASWLAGDEAQADRLAGELEGLWRLHAWCEVYVRVLRIAVVLSRRRGDRALEERVLEDFSLVAERRNLPRLQIAVRTIRAQRGFLDGAYDVADRGYDEALEMASACFPELTTAAAGLRVPIYIQKARLALQRRTFDAAAQLLKQIKDCSDVLQDGEILLEASLIEAHVALRARRYRDVSQLLSQCMHEIRRTGMHAPLRNHAAFVLELDGYARTHAINVDAGLLSQAVSLVATTCDTSGQDEQRTAPVGGRLLLTDRETDILHLLADGLSSKEMARRLSIAEGTVKTHRRHLYEKLEAGRRAHAIVRARELGLL